MGRGRAREAGVEQVTRGINMVSVSGNVTKDIRFGETDGGHEFCSFSIISEKKERKKRTFVTINVYQPGLVLVCRDRVEEGGYVVVTGELMNPDHRSGCEIRCLEIVFR
jgi:single-stranded DNA-binding protein